jgi:hypothetical protein
LMAGLEYERKLMIGEALTGISFGATGTAFRVAGVAVIYPLSCLYGGYGCLMFQVFPHYGSIRFYGAG